MAITHTKVSGIADGADTTVVRPSDWNADHTIANDSITYAMLQNVTATDKLLGRSTAGAGDIEEIACTAAGRALIDDADAAAQRTTLGLGTAATQASGAFEAAGAIATHAAVTTTHGISAFGATLVDDADAAAARTTLGAAATSHTHPTTDLTGGVHGDVLYRGAAGWVLLTAGTPGQYLKTQGAAANPAWADVSGAGPLALSQHVISANTTVTAAYGAIVPRYVELGDTFTLEIGDDADLEIT